MANAKGGVQKTTLVTNIGGFLAAPDRKVLIVDLDPQGNCGDDLGYRGTDIDDRGAALARGLMPDSSELPTPVKNVRPGLDVFVGGEEMHRVVPWLAQSMESGAAALERILAPVVEDYELVLIDLPPGDWALRAAALGVSWWLLIPTKSDGSSTSAVRECIRTMNTISQPGGVNENLNLLGIVLTDMGTGSSQVKRSAVRNIQQQLEADEVPEIFLSQMRHVERVAQLARERGRLFHELEVDAINGPKWWEARKGTANRQDILPATSSNAALDVQQIAKELVTRIAAAEEQRESEVA